MNYDNDLQWQVYCIQCQDNLCQLANFWHHVDTVKDTLVPNDYTFALTKHHQSAKGMCNWAYSAAHGARIGLKLWEKSTPRQVSSWDHQVIGERRRPDRYVPDEDTTELVPASDAACQPHCPAEPAHHQYIVIIEMYSVRSRRLAIVGYFIISPSVEILCKARQTLTLPLRWQNQG